MLDAFARKEPPKSIAKWLNPPLSHVAIWNYRVKHFEPTLAKASQAAARLSRATLNAAADANIDIDQEVRTLTADAMKADPLLARIEKKYSNYDVLTSEAVKDKDFKGFAAVDRAETAALTLHAQLTGRLQQAQTNVAVQVVFGAPPAETSEIRPLETGSVIDLDPIR